MNKKRDIFEKDLFRQAGEDLWRKVREVEQLDSKFALSSWQKVEERLKAPRTLSSFFCGGGGRVTPCHRMLFLDGGG